MYKLIAFAIVTVITSNLFIPQALKGNVPAMLGIYVYIRLLLCAELKNKVK